MLAFLFISFCLLLCTSAETLSNHESPTTTGCNDMGDCLVNQEICEKKCGCSSEAAVLFYNDTIGECVVDIKRLLQTLSDKSNTQEKLREDVAKVFQGIIFSAILFSSCAAVCAFTACIYCCRINYMDTQLKNDVDALAHKLKREGRYKRMTMKKTETQPKAESCNIIVEEAGLFVV